MLEKKFEQLYLWFRANYYRRMVQEIGTRKGSLSATESYCAEIIYLLCQPTATEFARFLNISVPNANYKINALVDKGYVLRQPSSKDRRESLLVTTDKFRRYYELNHKDTARLIRRIRRAFTPEEVAQLDEYIGRIVELMTTPNPEREPDAPNPRTSTPQDDKE